MLQFVIVGLALGAVYALAASGLVITYVSTGILNFAFGSLAFIIARTYYWLHVEKAWGILPAAGLCLFVLAPGIGLFLYLIIFRFLRLSSQLIKVVVTIGLSVAIPPLASVLFGQQTIFLAPGLAPQPVSSYDVFGAAVNLDQIITYACVFAIVVVGALVLRFTEAGLSVRAMVDSEAMTSLSGSDPSRIAAGVWMVATFLAGLAGVLVAPVIGVDDPGSYTLLIAAAFAAVIAARFRSLPVAVGVAMLMGIVGSLIEYALPPDSEVTKAVRPSIPFVFIAISLVYNIARTGRVSEEEGVGGALDRAIKPYGGARLAAGIDLDSPYPRVNFFFPVVVFGVFCLAPTILDATTNEAPYWIGQLGAAAALGIVFLSFTLVTGEGGMLWLCQVIFAGVGAVATAQFATEAGWPVIPSIIVGGVIAAAIGIALGVVTIRLGNLYVALVTLTFALLMEQLVFQHAFPVFEQPGYAVARPFGVGDEGFFYIALGAFAILALMIVNLRRSTTGLALNAVRWSETASRTMGLSVVQMKVLVAGLAAFVAGVGGGFYASQQKQAIHVPFFVTLAGLIWLAVLVTFGVRSNIAALLAATAFTITPLLLPKLIGSADAIWKQLPVLLFALGAIYVAKNPEGTVHANAIGAQRLYRRLSGTGTEPARTTAAAQPELAPIETKEPGDPDKEAVVLDPAAEARGS